jgi:hypothetical protein
VATDITVGSRLWPMRRVKAALNFKGLKYLRDW